MSKEKVAGLSGIIIGILEMFVIYFSRVNVFEKLFAFSRSFENVVDTTLIDVSVVFVLALGFTNIVLGLLLIGGRIKGSKALAVSLGLALISILITVAAFWITYFSAIFSVYNIS